MAKKQNAQAAGPQQSSVIGWGADVKMVRMPRGSKIEWTSDCDMLLQFIGNEDITENLDAEQQAVNAARNARAIIHNFFDGRQLVSMNQCYATSKVEWKAGHWFYIHLAAEIEMGNQRPMKDLVIYDVGATGDTRQCPPRVDPSCSITLSPERCAELNYNFLNYPLRTK